jgi:hypothetical protein
VYATGVAGNRIVEILYHDVVHFEAHVADAQCKYFNREEAEFAARNHSEIARDWVERHKTYRKILRTASFSSFLFALSIAGYHASFMAKRQRAFPWLRRPTRTEKAKARQAFQRYDARHYAAALLLCLFFVTAFYEEDKHFKADLCKHQSFYQTKAPGP